MSKKTRVAMMIDNEVLAKIDGFAQEMGLNRSAFTEMVYRQILNAEGASLAEFITGVLKDVFTSTQKKPLSKKGAKK